MTTSLTTSREGRKSARRLPSTVLAMEAAGSRADRSPFCGRGAAGGLPAPPPCRSRAPACLRGGSPSHARHL